MSSGGKKFTTNMIHMWEESHHQIDCRRWETTHYQNVIEEIMRRLALEDSGSMHAHI